MTKRKSIVDIRYYESGKPNIAGNSLPANTGTIFAFSKTIHAQGVRIARKLRELGFITGDFDHVYINFTTLLDNGVCKLSDRKPEAWLRYVDYGATQSLINELTEDEKLQFVTDSTFHALDLFRDVAPQNSEIAASVCRLITQYGAKLKILHKLKETKSYRISISYQIRPQDTSSVGWIEYANLENGQTNFKPFAKLTTYEDIFPLIGSISVSDGIVTLKPRSSFKADILTDRYTTPIRIPVEEILNGKHPTNHSSAAREATAGSFADE